MKKIFLAAACLLTLTACSPTSQKQPKQETKASQSQSASKSQKEEVQTKTFSNKIMENQTNKMKFFYTKDKILSFQIIVVEDLSESSQKESLEDLTRQYQENIDKSPSLEPFRNLEGVTTHLEIAQDKKTVSVILDFDLSKVDMDQLIASLNGSDDGEASSESNEGLILYKKIQGKPEDFFNYLRKQNLTEE